MTPKFAKLLVALALAGAAFGAASGPASAAVVSGSKLAFAPFGNTLCPTLMGNPPGSCTAAISFLPTASRASGGYRAGIDGVIVSWSLRKLETDVSHSVRLRVIHNTTGSGTGPVESLPLEEGVHSFPARLPVQEGDLIGIDTLNVPVQKGVPILRPFLGSTLDFWNPPLLDGEERNPSVNEQPDLELLINATIEPDADGDGFGDETQDGCPTVANGGAACPPPPNGGGGGGGGGGSVVPPPPVPDTQITKGPKGNVTAKRATYRFTSNVAGATFQCKLDKKPFRGCKSPKTYKGLADGRHTFKVRAVGPTGLVDPSPAKRTFRVGR